MTFVYINLSDEAVDLAKSTAKYLAKRLHGKYFESLQGAFEVQTAKGNRIVVKPETINMATIELYKANIGRIKSFQGNPKAHEYIMQQISETATRH